MSAAGVFDATVSRITDLTHDVRAIVLTLDSPSSIQFQPGQFVSFSVQRPTEKYATTRAYTIASSPDVEREILLLLNLVPAGPGSEYLFSLKQNDATRFRGPFGTFVLKAGTTDLLFVANDTGIVPFLSMLDWLAANQPERKATLLWGLQGDRDIFYSEHLTRLSEAMPNFSYTLVLAQPEAGSAYAQGRVQDLAAAHVESVENLEAFLCGNAAMLRDVRDMLRDKGPCPVHREPYYNDVKK